MMYPFAVRLADFDPGTLTAFYTMLLTVGLVVLCLVLAGFLFFMKARRTALALLMVAAICFAVGLCAAIVIIWLSQKGIIHLL
jgi:hypothetical protein